MVVVAVNDLHKSFGTNKILDGLSFDVKDGDRLGLLGKNGSGKTTLFKLIKGIESPDSGYIQIAKEFAVGMLEQIPDYPADYSTYDVIHTAFDNLMKIKKEIEEIEIKLSTDKEDKQLLNRYGKLLQYFEMSEGYLINENIKKVCNGLGIEADMLENKFENLSGGQKTMVMLAKILLQKPDILLLDEPTNHLDLRGIEWLEDYLSEYKGTVIIISHDRYFLDKAVTRIVEIVDGKAELYEGSYSFYLKEKDERYEQRLRQYENEQKKIKQLEEAAKKMHEWAKQADSGALHRRAFAMEKRIERIKTIDRPKPEKGFSFYIDGNNSTGEDVIVAKGITKSFGAKLVLDNTSIHVRKGQRIALMGDNGSGKTTLIKIILGYMEPDSGICKIGQSVRYAYLEQNVHFDNPERTILEEITYSLKLSEESARNLLAKYAFKGEDVFKKLEDLSGGEKSRLRLCMVIQKSINLMILDEPTNHLDIASREALENALLEFEGTMLFVSHDRYFVNKFASTIMDLENGKIETYIGNYDTYRNKKAQKQEIKKQIKDCDRIRQNQREDVRQKRIAYRDRPEIKKQRLEREMKELEAELSRLQDEMDLNSTDYEALSKLMLLKEKYDLRLEEILEELLKLEE